MRSMVHPVFWRFAFLTNQRIAKQIWILLWVAQSPTGNQHTHGEFLLMVLPSRWKRWLPEKNDVYLTSNKPKQVVAKNTRLGRSCFGSHEDLGVRRAAVTCFGTEKVWGKVFKWNLGCCLKRACYFRWGWL